MIFRFPGIPSHSILDGLQVAEGSVVLGIGPPTAEEVVTEDGSQLGAETGVCITVQ